MGTKPRLSVARVKKALEDNNGIMKNAAVDLGRCRQTISRYVEKHNLQEFIEGLTASNINQCKSTLLNMALGKISEERITKEDKKIIYSRPPHFPALKLQLEIYGIYTPKIENIDVPPETKANTAQALENMTDDEPTVDESA